MELITTVPRVFLLLDGVFVYHGIVRAFDPKMAASVHCFIIPYDFVIIGDLIRYRSILSALRDFA